MPNDVEVDRLAATEAFALRTGADVIHFASTPRRQEICMRNLMVAIKVNEMKVKVASDSFVQLDNGATFKIMSVQSAVNTRLKAPLVVLENPRFFSDFQIKACKDCVLSVDSYNMFIEVEDEQESG